MNINGTARGHMAKCMPPNRFIQYVVKFIDRQLKELDGSARAELNPFYNRYYVKVVYQERFHIFSFTEEAIRKWQTAGPYALDGEIWDRLFERGVSVPVRGKYLTMMLYKTRAH